MIVEIDRCPLSIGLGDSSNPVLLVPDRLPLF